MNWRNELTTQQIDRLEEKMSMQADRNGECYLWLGAKNNLGRPLISIDGRLHVATRIIYSLHHNVDIPDRNEDGERVVIAHTCHNPSCVHVGHLVMCTQKENIHMSWDDGRYPVGHKHSQSKLTEGAVAHCRRLYRTGKYTIYKLAKMYGVSQWAMNKAIRGETWRTVEEAPVNE